jgi:hypothetical protein
MTDFPEIWSNHQLWLHTVCGSCRMWCECVRATFTLLSWSLAYGLISRSLLVSRPTLCGYMTSLSEAKGKTGLGACMAPQCPSPNMKIRGPNDQNFHPRCVNLRAWAPSEGIRLWNTFIARYRNSPWYTSSVPTRIRIGPQWVLLRLVVHTLIWVRTFALLNATWLHYIVIYLTYNTTYIKLHNYIQWYNCDKHINLEIGSAEDLNIHMDKDVHNYIQ